MNLQTLKNEISELTKQISCNFSTQYNCNRTKKGNLKVTFEDEVMRLPVIDFRPYQLEYQNKLFAEKKKIFVVLPRRAGKEVLSWNCVIQAAIETPGSYMMIYPKNKSARRILWTGNMILENGRSLKFLDMIPARLIASVNNTEMTITLINGSVIWVLGSDVDPESLRGTNPRGVVISEFSYSDPRVLFNVLMPVLRQNKGWLFIQTTFNGMNHAYHYMQEVKNNPEFFCRVESALTLVDERGDRYVTDEMIEADRKAGMPEYMIQQEYFSIVEVNSDIFYFSNEIKEIYDDKRIIPDLFIVNAPVYVFKDIGMNDNTFLIMVQFDRNGNPIIIGCHEKNNQIFEYYVDYATRFCRKRGLIIRTFFSPHDGKKREFGSGKNIIDFGLDIGVEVMIVPRPVCKINAIQQMRKMLYRTKFNKEETQRLIDCLSSYQKQFDEKLNIYINDPLHNWCSHGVDAYQTMTLAIDAQMIGERSCDVIYNMS